MLLSSLRIKVIQVILLIRARVEHCLKFALLSGGGSSGVSWKIKSALRALFGLALA
jgi:hypothetical protein